MVSVFAACRDLADAPSDQTIRNALAATLPDLPELERRLNLALVTELPPVNVLFNCAGYVAGGSLLSGSDADWELSLALNVTAMARLTRTGIGAIPC